MNTGYGNQWQQERKLEYGIDHKCKSVAITNLLWLIFVKDFWLSTYTVTTCKDKCPTQTVFNIKETTK